MPCSLWPVAQVDQVWPAIAEGMVRSCKKSGGGIVAGDVWRECRSGSAFLIIAHDDREIHGASVWYPQNGKLRCMALFGKNMKAWIGDMHDLVKRIAKGCGATALVSEGRVGWERIFPKARKVRIYYEEAL